MLRFLRENELGISITELLVTLALIWIVTGAVFSVLVLGEDIWSTGEKQVDAQRQARIAFMRMVKEIRQCYEVVNTTDYPTNNYTLSMRGIQIINETLTDTGDHKTYQASHYPWLWNVVSEEGARPTIYVDGVVATSGYTISPSDGRVTFTSSDSDRVVKADYTYDAYLKYRLINSELLRSINDSDEEVVTEYVVNQAQQGIPIFSKADNLFSVTLIIDKDASRPPQAYTLETEVRLRK